MKISASIAFMVASFTVAALWGAGAGKLALPGYQFQFPRDHFSHPEFATEWWYYTGNLTDPAGRPFGFELTFFRQAIDTSATRPQPDVSAPHPSGSLISSTSHISRLATSKANSSSTPNASIARARAWPASSLDQGRYWNGNWQVRWQLPGSDQHLQAITPELTLQLGAHGLRSRP